MREQEARDILRTAEALGYSDHGDASLVDEAKRAAAWLSTRTHEHEAHEYAPTAIGVPAGARALREHVNARHGASDDWAAMVDADLIREWHNREHGRDWHGVQL